VLLAGVALVLVIACANVANLVLVRAEARAREVAVRRAIGAGRGALRRYFLVEGVVLSLGAAAIGLGLAALAIDALTALAPPGLPRLDEVRVRPATVLLALGAAGAIGLLFGSFPVLGSSERALSRALGEGGRGRTFGARAVRIRGWLLAGQVALALVLLTASGLMVRSLSRLAAVDAGFEEEGVLTFRVGLPSADYPDADAVYRFHRGMLDRLAASGLVEAAGAIDQMPISGGDRCMLVFPEEEYLAPDRPIGCPSVRFVGAGYFEAMGIAVVEGRALERADEESRAGSIVVSRSMASRIWPDLDTPLGRGLRLWGEGFYRVVGVVEDVRDRGLDVPAAGAVYFPLRPLTGESFPPLSAVTYVVRSASGVTEGLAAEARAAVADLDPRLPIAELRTFEEIVDRSMIRTTFTLLLMSLASAMALLIGVVGIYGVVSYVVAQRRREVGVRMALGARGGQVTALVVGDVGRHAAVGLVLGVAAALPGTRLLRSLLFEVSPTDPVTLVAVPTLLAGVVLLAAWLPARRAARVDPVQALRAD
jgi:predicted permease